MYSTTKEASQAVRKAMKELNLSVNVRIMPGSNAVQVYTKTFEGVFTESEKLVILSKLHSMGFVGVRGTDLSTCLTCDPNTIGAWLK